MQLERPYDWLVVSDHAEYLGLPQAFADMDPAIMNTETGRKWAAALKKGGKAGYEAFVQMTKEFADAKPSIPRAAQDKLAHTIWERAIDAAERNNKPGVFTAFNGFEWTQTLEGNNLHRIVVFRDGANRTEQVRPFSEFSGADPEELWKYMADYEAKTGGRMLAVEHNPNLSGGKMFAPTTESGKPFDAKYAAMRAHFDRLAEANQCKGDSETTPELSPKDPFAAFDVRWNKVNIFGTVATTPEMLPYNYVRSALKLGLQHEAKLGVNPFKFGMIGGSDQHTSLSTTRAENYFGMATIAKPKPDRWKEPFMRSELSPKLNMYMWEALPGGLGGVWPRRTRARPSGTRSTGGRSTAPAGRGPRCAVFGGWDFTAKELNDPEPVWVEHGYAHGVPMGGDLTKPPAGKAPTFMVKATCDPDGAFLDRIQIIKGWLDGKGEAQEKVIDVAWSGDRKPDPKTGQAPLVGSAVDVKNATWTNTIGAPLLTGFWKDPDFDPAQRAFYYVRMMRSHAAMDRLRLQALRRQDGR